MPNHDDDTNAVSGKTGEKSSRTQDDAEKSISHGCELFHGGEGKWLEGRVFEVTSSCPEVWELKDTHLSSPHLSSCSSQIKAKAEVRDSDTKKSFPSLWLSAARWS